MSSPEVDWVLDQLASVVESVATDYSLRNGNDVVLKRVDRDDAQLYDGSESVDMSTPLRKRTAELRNANYVGATFADREPTARGPGYDHNVEAVIGLRCEGLHCSEFGHVDPGGEKGVAFDELVRRIRQALLAERKYPSIDSPDGSYYTLELGNEAPQSSNWADYYRHDLDVLLHGEQDL